MNTFLPLLPLRELVVFPSKDTDETTGSLYPLEIGRPKSLAAVRHAIEHQTHLIVAPQLDPKSENPTPQDFAKVGTLIRILGAQATPTGLRILADAHRRILVREWQEKGEFYWVRGEELADSLTSKATRESIHQLRARIEKCYLDKQLGSGSPWNEIKDPNSCMLVGSLLAQPKLSHPQILEIYQTQDYNTLWQKLASLFQTEEAIESYVETCFGRR